MTVPTYSLDCVAFGVPFRLEASSEALLAAMLDAAPWNTSASGSIRGDAHPFSIIREPGPAPYQFLVLNKLVAQSAEQPAMLQRFSCDLMVHVADHAPDRVFVHAGVVGRNGCALLLPGRSFAGKTTLVAALVQAGADYVSDEYAVLDHSGQVHPYTRSLQVRSHGSPEQVSVPVAELGGKAVTLPLPVAHVAFVDYAAGALWNPTPVPPGLAVLEMLRHTLPIRRSPARVLSTMASTMKSASALRSSRGEAKGAAEAMLNLMDAARA